jgi:geranylgeranyl diphosphate synthase type I
MKSMIYPQIVPYLSKVEHLMSDSLSREDERIYGLLVPFMKRGGKRIRPVLTLLSCGASGGDYDSVISPAAIIELFHNFTLIHDDIEDNSQFRRGEPALHISSGIPMALNSGDALYTLIWEQIASLPMEPKKLFEFQKIYASAFKRVVEGQGIEISWIHHDSYDVGEKDYLQMINGKTSALMGLACEAGAFIAGGKHQKGLREYGEKIGTAFQIHDDVLNVVGDFEKYKKEIGGDISEGKRTLMVVHCLDNSSAKDKKTLKAILSKHTNKQEEIRQAIGILKDSGSIDYAKNYSLSLVGEAKKLLGPLPDTKDRASLLKIADYVVTREL